MMQFRWQKKGRIFNPEGRHEWMQSHSQNPFVLPMQDRLRVYFNCRGKKGADGNVQAYPAYADLAPDNPGKVIAISEKPLLNLGEPGTFDQFGVMASSILEMGDEIWMYYVGWNRCGGVPFNHAIGLAISRDGGNSFSRYGKGPILTRTHNEPFIQNSPFVLKVGDMYHMWYGTGTEWIKDGDTMETIYVMAHATSTDGKEWRRDGIPCMPARVDKECQTNPSVIRIGGRYHMWFCYRCGVDFRNAGRSYRIGYAWSDDLITWHRDDGLNEIEPSPGNAWDSQMLCYPRVLPLNNRLHLFYSGNGFGATGFGYAVAEG